MVTSSSIFSNEIERERERERERGREAREDTQETRKGRLAILKRPPN